MFLVDSESDVTIIKISALKKNLKYNASDIISMRGITDGRRFSLGSMNIFLIFKHLHIEHKVHIVTDDFPIRTDGIIGKDFNKRHACLIDFGAMEFTIRPKNMTPATIPIHEIAKDTVPVPERSESFQMLRIEAEKYPCIVEAQEVNKHVFVPTTIVHQRDSWIRILNVNIHSVNVSSKDIKTSNIDDYDIGVFKKPKSDKKLSNRQTHLSQLLNAKMPSHIRAKLLPLCLEFDDVFHLPSDKATVNNFYTKTQSTR